VSEYIVRRMLRVGGVTYDRGEMLSADAAEGLPERTRQALERLGWIEEARQDGQTQKVETKQKRKPRKRGEP